MSKIYVKWKTKYYFYDLFAWLWFKKRWNLGRTIISIFGKLLRVVFYFSCVGGIFYDLFICLDSHIYGIL